MAGRHLPVHRALAAVIVAGAVGATSAAAEGEWAVQRSSGKAQGGGTWQVAPTPGSWSVTSGDAATPAPAPTPESILDALVEASNNAAPPVPPAPLAMDIAAPPTVQLDPDTPEVKALAAAEAELDAIEAEIADVRTRLDSASEAQAAELTARDDALSAKKAAAAARVDELRAEVDRLQKEAEAKAAEAAANQASPYATIPGLTFAPVTATVPVIDAAMAGRLDSYLAGKGSPLAGNGNSFVYQASAVGLDPRLLVAISGAETSFGTYGPSQTINNPFGMGPGIVYPSWDDAIAAAARNLGGSLYKGSGLVTITQIQQRWAPLGAGNDPGNLNSNWYRNVTRYYAELGGDPNGSVFTDRRASQAAIPVAPGVAPGIQGTIAAPSAYGPSASVPGGGRNTGPAAVQLAVKFVGASYRAGGASPSTGFDAPGLVQYAYRAQGVTLPSAAEQQAAVGTPISPEQLAPGDAVFFAKRDGQIVDEGLYVGKGYFVHSPGPRDVVKISSLYEPYFATLYAGARRY